MRGMAKYGAMRRWGKKERPPANFVVGNLRAAADFLRNARDLGGPAACSRVLYQAVLGHDEPEGTGYRTDYAAVCDRLADLLEGEAAKDG